MDGWYPEGTTLRICFANAIRAPRGIRGGFDPALYGIWIYLSIYLYVVITGGKKRKEKGKRKEKKGNGKVTESTTPYPVVQERLPRSPRPQPALPVMYPPHLFFSCFSRSMAQPYLCLPGAPLASTKEMSATWGERDG